MKNYSRQREEIIKTVQESYDHPTVVENNLINKISMLVGPDRYDAVREKHNHAICTKCGKVFDFKYDFEYEKLKKMILKQTGVEISEKGIALEGICNSCKKLKN